VVSGAEASLPGRQRREPPPFRRAVVARRSPLGGRLVRVTLAGPELEGFPVPPPAASVRVLLPSPGSALVVPVWTGNEYLLPEGRRPVLRTLTPRAVDPERAVLELDVLVHGEGAASQWAAGATVGSPVAVSGPGRGAVLDPGASAYLVAGDETALAAVAQLLECLPATTAVTVVLETAEPGATVALPGHPGADVRWVVLPPGARPGDALVRAVVETGIEPGTALWAAGEAAAMQRLRRHLFDELGLARSGAAVRGYWKMGRAGDVESTGAPQAPPPGG